MRYAPGTRLLLFDPTGTMKLYIVGTREGSHWLVMSLFVYAGRYPRGFPLVGNDIKMKRLPESDSFGGSSRGAG